MTSSEPAPTTTRWIPRLLVTGLLVLIAANAAALGYPLLASSSSTVASPSGVLHRGHPAAPGDAPPSTLTAADVADTDRRRGQQESVVSIAAGERLTERQALQALLLPSANNIAAVLARWDAGSADRFVAEMNATARSLGMSHTRYTDPSGYDDATVSTASRRRSPGWCWASPARTRSRRVSRPPRPWSTASPVSNALCWEKS